MTAAGDDVDLDFDAPHSGPGHPDGSVSEGPCSDADAVEQGVESAQASDQLDEPAEQEDVCAQGYVSEQVEGVHLRLAFVMPRL